MAARTHIAFLRAVNLGRRRVAMSRLVELLEGLGYDDVWTSVNSGNVVFDAPGSRATLEVAIGEVLEKEFGFEVTTFVRSAAELRTIVEEEPFTLAPGDTHFVTLLSTVPSPAAVRELESVSNDFDTLVVRGRDVHWHMRGKSTDSTLKSKDWLVAGRYSTSRNMTMLRKLLAKLDV